MLWIGLAVLVTVAFIGSAVSAYAQLNGVEPTYPEVCPPACAGGLVITNPDVGGETYGVPGLAGEEIWVNVDDGDGYWVDFESDVPVVRVAITVDDPQTPCTVYTFGTDPLVFEASHMHSPGWQMPTQIEICFAGGRILVYKFEDLNMDGAYDAEEPMLEDWRFSLTALYEVPWNVGEGTTDANGELMFPNLEPGVEHVITETLPDGWVSTTGGVTQDGIYVEGDGVTEVWFGNAREEQAPPTPTPEPEPVTEPEPVPEAVVLPMTGANMLLLLGGAALFASGGIAARRASRRGEQ
jgi:hypothetical protein